MTILTACIFGVLSLESLDLLGETDLSRIQISSTQGKLNIYKCMHVCLYDSLNMFNHVIGTHFFAQMDFVRVFDVRNGLFSC